MLKNSICEPPCIFVMEDNTGMGNAIKQCLEEKLDWKVDVVNNKQETIKRLEKCLEKQQPSYFILDNCINNNNNEGLDALEYIKEKDEKAFAGILTGFSTEHIKKQADKLKADFFQEKSSDIEKDSLNIAEKMLYYRREQFNREIDEQIKKLKQNLIIDSDSDSDSNITAYEKLKLDSKWLEENQGKYVAFVDGEFLSSYDKKEDLLEALIDSPEYYDKQRFFKKVEEQPRIIDEPTSLWQDIIYS